ncbi:AraC family transcriptional regulator [Paenibacillus sp. GYB003]|uniref:AraC family transcriptional regulator n=1 Tax=Paenibacillus sp. GYB003 TaxID=2994392 RepID=UPI002F96CD9D
MYIYHEKVKYENPLVPLKIFMHRKVDGVWNDWHCHKQAEMLYILRGGLDVFVEKRRYELRDGDLILIGSNQLHRDYSRAAEYIVFQFDSSQYSDSTTMPYFNLFMDSRIALDELNYIFQENGNARQDVIACLLDIYKEMQNKGFGYEMAVSLHIRRLLLALLRSDTRKLLSAKHQPDLERLRPVLDYIDKNPGAKMTIKEASRMVNISYSHFVAYFKKVIGMSFVDYFNYRRIKMAERILLTEDVSVEEAGVRIGMENRGHFYRMFRKFNGCSPKEFCKKMKGYGQ